MDPRFTQAHKEARWAVWLTLAYLLALAAGRLPAGFTAGNHRLASLV